MIDIELIKNSSFSDLHKYMEGLDEGSLTKHEMLEIHIGMIQRGGISYMTLSSENQTTLLGKAGRFQHELYFELERADDSLFYSQSLLDQFHYAKCAIAECFFENYLTLDRHEIIDKLFAINKKEQFFNALDENLNNYQQAGLYYSTILSSLLGQFYILLDDMDNAISSIMNAAYFYGASIERNALPSDERIKQFIHDDITKRARAANDGRWQGHVEQLRRKYLELDESRQGNADRKPTIKAVAQWIYQHHNEQDLELETIRDHLSKARRGIFTND